jgi:uncharacterized surface protein with fasciclin (FAS1) repeats
MDVDIRKPILAASTAFAFALPATARDADIVETATAADQFSTLVELVGAAGLVDTLQAEGPFTVFGPTDDAFLALAKGTLVTLTAEENREALTRILTYHAVSGAVPSGDLEDGTSVETLEGGTVTISLGDGVTVNDANVVTPDAQASNGVIHVIVTVLVPPE